MSVVSGVISRQVLPACGSLCFFCPAMRARSRQPVKRYKKLIADIFPRNQVGFFFCMEKIKNKEKRDTSEMEKKKKKKKKSCLSFVIIKRKKSFLL
jgi:hypothetical protein